jgi:hypothetical protein
LLQFTVVWAHWHIFFKDDGVQFETFHGCQTFRGALVAFLGDIPAANLIGGFKESVGKAMRMCRTCYCIRNNETNEMITKVKSKTMAGYI